jgi:hypothetical protein
MGQTVPHLGRTGRKPPVLGMAKMVPKSTEQVVYIGSVVEDFANNGSPALKLPLLTASTHPIDGVDCFLASEGRAKTASDLRLAKR